MASTRKILVFRLSPGIAAALGEHLAHSCISSPEPQLDLIITDSVGQTFLPAEVRRGTPILVIDRKQRMGILLREADMMMKNPSFYAEDFSLGACRLRPQEKILLRPTGSEVHLTDRETDVLVYLAKRADRSVSREELLRDIWQHQEGVDSHTLETHIYRLRHKAPEIEEMLVTEESGYRLMT